MTVNDIDKNGWNEWEKHVLISLKRLEEQNDKFDEKIGENKDGFLTAIGEVRTDIKILETKMSTRSVLSGAIAGIVPALGILIYFLLTG